MPHLYSVGKPYHPDRKVWPQANQLNWMSGELELLLFFDRPSRHEIEAVRVGRSEFALYDLEELVVLSYRFDGKRAEVPWFDAPYQWHLVPVEQRVPPPAPDELGPETRVGLHVVLVNAMGGLIEALRLVTLSPEFTRGLFAAIRRQAAVPYVREAYDRSLHVLCQRYSSEQLVAASSFRCEGGA